MTRDRKLGTRPAQAHEGPTLCRAHEQYRQFVLDRDGFFYCMKCLAEGEPIPRATGEMTPAMLEDLAKLAAWETRAERKKRLAEKREETE